MSAKVSHGAVEDRDLADALAEEVRDEPLDSGNEALRCGGVRPPGLGREEVRFAPGCMRRKEKTEKDCRILDAAGKSSVARIEPW